MPKPARKSSRNTSKDENGQESELGKEHSRSPTPENDRLRERTRSGSSSSSRSPTPEKPTRSRRGRQPRGRASKRGGGRRKGNYTAKSRSSSSSSEDVAPKRKQRRTNSISSRSRSRSPQLVSPEVTRRSSRRIVTNRTTPEHPAHEETDDKPANKSKKTEVEEIPEQQISPAKKKQKVSVAESPSDAPEEKSVDEAATPPSDPLPQTITEAPVAEESNKVDIPAATSSTDTVKDSLGEISTSEPVTNKEDSGKIQPEEKPSIVVPLPTSINNETSLKEAHIESVPPVPALVESSPKETETQAEKCPISSGGKVQETEGTLESTNSESLSCESKISVELTKQDNVVEDEMGRKSPSKSPPPRSRRKSRSSSSSSGSRTRSKSAKSKPARSRSSSSESRSRSRSSSSSSSDSSGTKPPRVTVPLKKSKSLASPPALEKVASTELQDKSQNTSQSVPVNTQIVKQDGDSKPSEDALSSAQTPTNQQAESDKESDHHKTAQKDTIVTIALDKAVREEAKDTDIKKVDTCLKKEKVAKKRRWNSKTSKAAKPLKRTTSLEISSDSLKNLIGDVKLTETVFDMETEVVNTLDYDDHEEDKRDVKMKRTIVQSPQSDDEKEEVSQELGSTEDIRIMELQDEELKEELQAPEETEKKIVKLAPLSEKETKKVKEGKKQKKKKGDKMAESGLKEEKITEKENKELVFASTRPIRPILPAADEPEPVSGLQSPARNTPDRVIYIAGLVRPFTVGQLKELLKRSGELDEDYFWINDIKSHCLAAYKSKEDAVKARAALHKTKWPQSNPKILTVDFASIEDVIRRKAEGDAPLPAVVKKPIDIKRLQEQKEEEEQRERRQKARELREKEREEKEREKRDEKDKTRKREAERKNPVREWDRDKVQQLSKSRSRSKERERQRRSRSNEKGQRKRRDPSREKKEDEKKKDKKLKESKTEEEPPAKLLDDLFRKTKAVPCIYWLPLTEEQAAQRVIRKQELEKERQKRIAAAEEREKEEMKRREAARLERLRERERERSRERESRRQERSRSSRSERSRSRRRR